MKNLNWTIYLVTPSVQADRRIRIPRVLITIFLAIALFGLAGTLRCLWFSVSYVYAKVGVENLRRQNANQQKTVRFLEKFAAIKEQELARLTTFENMARMKYGMNTIEDDVRLAGVGGAPDIEQLLLTSLEDPAVSQAGRISARIQTLLRQACLLDSTFSRTNYHVVNQNALWAQRPSISPAQGKITSGFGYRFHPLFARTIFHEGLDIANKQWTPIVATADGIVAEASYVRDYGNMIKIDHAASGYATVYAHLCQISVEQGQVVKRGELIGYLGNTGLSTGPHLHYEVRVLNKFINPLDHILPVNTVVD